MSDDPIGDGLNELLDAAVAEEIRDDMLMARFIRWVFEVIDKEYEGVEFDVKADFERLSGKLRERERVQRMERIEALAFILGTAAALGSVSVGAGWLMVRGRRSKR